MLKLVLTSFSFFLVAANLPHVAHACGGFFCGQAPVDQSAEQIVFSVDEAANQTTMVVQIAYEGDSQDFSWIVPIAEVPIEGSLDTFPQQAMAFIEQSTRPSIRPDYATCEFRGGGGCGGGFCADASASAFDSGTNNPPNVNVLVQEAVGPFDTVVIESEDSDALITWLRDNDYRVTSSMIPYIKLYADLGLKFLALKLQPQRKVSEIVPFKMTLPGTSPSIPLKMTALAALPEMGVIVSVFANSRYQGANWPTQDLADLSSKIKFRNGQSNYINAVAKAIDEEGGQGWITELARPADELKSTVEFAFFGGLDEVEEEEIRTKLVDLIGERAYYTRLYSRLSPEEMTSDPVLRRSELGDVASLLNVRVNGDCNDRGTGTACDMTTCGAGGLCKVIETCTDDRCIQSTGCSCVPGTSARAFPGPTGGIVVACQDQQMSFLNPGDIEVPGADPVQDPCIGFDCGAGGVCVNINLSPSCVCDTGFVATIAQNGNVTCAKPQTRVDSSFFENRLPTRPAELPAGRDNIVMPKETPEGELAPVLPPAPSIPVSGCSVSQSNTDMRGPLGALLMLGIVAIRRRRS